MKTRLCIAGLILACILTTSSTSQAAIITATLGNSSPGFSDGDTPSLVGTGGVLDAISSNPSPFDAASGNDLFAPTFDMSWTVSPTDFDSNPFPATILDATFTIGIYDHNSAHTGDQVAAFTVDGTDQTSLLNTAFEGHGGGVGEYNVYTVTLDGGTFSDLGDGTVGFNLQLQNSPNSQYNGAFVIYTTLQLTTRDSTPNPSPVPEPSSLALMGLCLGCLGARRRWKRDC